MYVQKLKYGRNQYLSRGNHQIYAKTMAKKWQIRCRNWLPETAFRSSYELHHGCAESSMMLASQMCP